MIKYKRMHYHTTHQNLSLPKMIALHNKPLTPLQPETEFLDVIGTKVFFLAIHSHLY
jgi:hypothetical protein